MQRIIKLPITTMEELGPLPLINPGFLLCPNLRHMTHTAKIETGLSASYLGTNHYVVSKLSS